MRAASAAGGLLALQREIAAIEGKVTRSEGDSYALRLGVARIDGALQGGLTLGTLHELGPTDPPHRGAAFGFALALCCGALKERPAGDVLWIETPFAAAETGRPYGLGLASFGLSPARLLIVRVPRAIDVLWVLEEALKCRGIAAAIAELAEEGAAADLTATRRLSLAAREGGGLGLIVRHRPSPHASAAMTRWQIAAAQSRPDAFGGLGQTAFDLSLTKNRHGPCGRWTILWDHHERAFLDPALSVAVGEAPCDRPDRARLARAG